MRLDDLAEVTALARERAEIIQLYDLMYSGLRLIEVEYRGEPAVTSRLPELVYRAVQEGALVAYLKRLNALNTRLTGLGVVVPVNQSALLKEKNQ